MKENQTGDLEKSVASMLAKSKKVAKDDLSTSVNRILFESNITELAAAIREKISGQIIDFIKQNDEFLWFKITLRQAWILLD